MAGLKLFSGLNPSRFTPKRSKSVWSGSDVRRLFVDYFKGIGHTYVPSTSVCPGNDPTLFFVNSGMNQFKPIFLGTLDPNSPLSALKTVVNSQKCIRASGKHNDFKDVGHDPRHHTFFEMLGNWSFNGATSKLQSCQSALDLLVRHYKVPLARLHFTYFGGSEQMGLPGDLETLAVWRQLGVPEAQISAQSAEENFWEMEATGPCGPCTEIHFAQQPNCLVELWNLVFIQYSRDVKDSRPTPLPNCHLDTGMGLERLTALLQGFQSNYATDLFTPIIRAVQKETNAPAYRELYGPEQDRGGVMAAYRILADHSRMFAVAMADGVKPDSNGPGHVLRKVIRHAVYQASVLKAKPDLLVTLAKVAVEILGDAYPSLRTNLHLDVLRNEMDKFQSALDKGQQRFYQLLKSGAAPSPYQLYQLASSFGLPLEVLEDLCRRHLVRFDLQQIQHQQELHKLNSGVRL